MTYPFPQATQTILEQNRAAISNLHLYLSRYIDREVDQAGDGWGVNKEEKALRRAPAILQQAVNQALITDYAGRWRATVTADPGAQAFTARARTRCAVGLGAKGAREVGLRLHHLYGFPIIPGSALKGLTRAYATLIWAEKLGGSLGQEPADVLAVLTEHERRAGSYQEAAFAQAVGARFARSAETVLATIKALPGDTVAAMEDIINVCGAQAQAGRICFFDAVPTGPVVLETDIINPHYPDYYRAFGNDPNAPPADYYSPIPVMFLTVAAETIFLFAVALRRDDNTDGKAATRLAQARGWLEGGLGQLGVGAKTTSGYGLFGEFTTVE